MEETGTMAYAEVPASGSHGHAGGPAITDISGPLMVLTWLAFLVMAWVLYKVAWKPILMALETREESIRTAQEHAAKARADLAQIEAQSRQIVAEANRHREELVSEAHAAAGEIVKAAEQRARELATAMAETARHEIEAATIQARLALRTESAELVTALAGQLIRQNLDSDANRVLVRKLAEDLRPGAASPPEGGR